MGKRKAEGRELLVENDGKLLEPSFQLSLAAFFTASPMKTTSHFWSWHEVAVVSHSAVGRFSGEIC